MTNFKGSGVALVTPFKSDKSVDFDALRNLVQLQIQGGTNFLVVMGTTAESTTRNPLGLAERVAIRAINFPESLQPILQTHPLAFKTSSRIRRMMVSGSEVLTKRNASSQETASTDEVIPSNTLSQSESLRD